MASTKRNVNFPGVLRGQGMEAQCEVWMVETTNPGLPPAKSQYRIRNVSKTLPDGNYTVTVNGESHEVQRQNGNWISAHS